MEALPPESTAHFSAEVWEKLAAYLDRLLLWNQRISLTATRGPKELAQRHIAESLWGAQFLPAGARTLLDFGSGAGLPGIPMQVARPEIAVTLAESQTKKAIFLQEVVRVLGQRHTQVYTGRVEAMPSWQCFDVVTLRAVDRMRQILPIAAGRTSPGGWCVVFTTKAQEQEIRTRAPEMEWRLAAPVPGAAQRIVLVGQRQ
jgi:16S rRNA (guanine527-N7)-methyltransferase